MPDTTWGRQGASFDRRNGNITLPCIVIMMLAMMTTMMMMLMPTIARATDADTSGSSYQIYDTRARTQQVKVNKVWDDGLSNDDRTYKSWSGATSTPYQSMMNISISRLPAACSKNNTMISV
jgi:hypothetical protein